MGDFSAVTWLYTEHYYSGMYVLIKCFRHAKDTYSLGPFPHVRLRGTDKRHTYQVYGWHEAEKDSKYCRWKKSGLKNNKQARILDKMKFNHINKKLVLSYKTAKQVWTAWTCLNRHRKLWASQLILSSIMMLKHEVAAQKHIILA